MAFEVKNEYVSKELEEEIKQAIKERRSIEQLLVEKKFVGTPESLEELTHILIRHMGVTMALGFIDSANQSEWENYRNILVNLWEKISTAGHFSAKDKLALGQSLCQQGRKDLGIVFLRKASINAENVKIAVDVARTMKRETDNNALVKEILIDAKVLAKSCDDYTNIAKAFFTLADDKKESRKTFEKAINLANTFPEHCTLATEILKSFKDRELAKKTFRSGLAKKDPASILDTLAEEDYKKRIGENEAFGEKINAGIRNNRRY